MRESIETQFYQEEQKSYAWYIQGRTRSSSDWIIFYPDAYAQLFPILWGAAEDEKRCQHLWERFHEYHGTILETIPVEQKIVYQWTREVMEGGTQGMRE